MKASGMKAMVLTFACAGLCLAAGAERPAPNANQLERIRGGFEIYGIVHWGLNTYTDIEWGYYRFSEVFGFVRRLQPSVDIFCGEFDDSDFRWPGWTERHAQPAPKALRIDSPHRLPFLRVV